MHAIDFENVSFSFSDKNDAQNFRIENVSFFVREGDFCSVIGANGSGKTTLLRLISGFLKAETGKVHVFDKEISNYKRLELSKKIAFVSQINPITFSYTVFETAAMGRFPFFNKAGFENTEDVKIIRDYLEMLDLLKIKEKQITQISGGELQRTYICRALVQQPKILIMDEPVSHLDIKNQLSSYKLLRKLKDEHKLTLILVSHDLNMTLQYSDNVILLKNGKILSQDIPDKIFTTENLKNAFGVDTVFLKDEKRKKYLVYDEQ